MPQTKTYTGQVPGFVQEQSEKLSQILPQDKLTLFGIPGRFQEYTGVGEPTEHSLELDQLQNIIFNHNPTVVGLYREKIKSQQIERQKLQDKLKDTSLSTIEKRQIDHAIQSIDDVIGETGKEIDDTDIANMIIRDNPSLQKKLKAYVPPSYGKPGSLIAVLSKSMGKVFRELPENVTPLLTGLGRYLTLRQDTPYQRRMYETGVNINLKRAEKLNELLENRDRSDNPDQYDAWQKELNEVNDFIEKHPEWKDDQRYPPESAWSPLELKFEKWMNKVEDAAREDLEKVSLMDTETLAYYRWVQQQSMRSFMDSRGFQAETFVHHLGQGLASFLPAAAAGIVTGLVTKSPTAGLTVGRSVMGVQEGGDQYNQAMQYALDKGLDIEEARELALGTGVTYGVGSAWMEGWVPGMWLKRFGLTVDKPIKSMLRKNLFGRINRNAVDRYASFKLVAGKSADKIPFFLQSAGAEGFQELSQYLYQVGIQADYMDEGGDNYIDRYMNVYDVSEAATSAYAGAVTGGVLGAVSGVVGAKGPEAAVEAAEKEREMITGVTPDEPAPMIEPVEEETYSDNKAQDYLIRLSDVRNKEQLLPEVIEDDATDLEVSIYQHQDDPSSVEKLFGLIEDVGVKVVKDIQGMSGEDKSNLLDLVLGHVRKENPDSKINTHEDALKFLRAFAQGGERVVTEKRIGLAEPVVSAKTKFDPTKISPQLREDLKEFGLPEDVFSIPPPEVKEPLVPKEPTVPTKPLVPTEPPIPKEPTLAQIAEMADKGVTSELVKYAKDISTADLTIKSVELVGSVAREGKGEDIDIFYDFGKRNIPDEIQEDSNELEIFVQEQILNESKSDIDIAKYDNIIKMTDQKGEKLYFHYNLESGLKHMTNQKVIDSIESGKSIDLIKVKAPTKPVAKKPVAKAPPGRTDHDKKIYDKHLDAIEKTDDPLKKLSAVQGVKTRMAADKSDTSDIESIINPIEEELKNQGYEIKDLEGMAWDDGMNVIADFVPDEELKQGERIIGRVIKPQIMKDGKIVQLAEVVVRQGTKKLTAEEFKKAKLKLDKEWSEKEKVLKEMGSSKSEIANQKKKHDRYAGLVLGELQVEAPTPTVAPPVKAPAKPVAKKPVTDVKSQAKKAVSEGKLLEDFVQEAEGLATRIGKVKLKTGGQYFSTKGTSTYWDPLDVSVGRNNYDITSAKLAISGTADAISVLREAAKDKTNRPKDLEKINSSLNDGFIDYKMADEIPSIVKAAKKLKFDGLKIMENDDISDPSSVLLWNTKKAKKVNLPQLFKAPTKPVTKAPSISPFVVKDSITGEDILGYNPAKKSFVEGSNVLDMEDYLSKKEPAEAEGIDERGEPIVGHTVFADNAESYDNLVKIRYDTNKDSLTVRTLDGAGMNIATYAGIKRMIDPMRKFKTEDDLKAEKFSRYYEVVEKLLADGYINPETNLKLIGLKLKKPINKVSDLMTEPVEAPELDTVENEIENLRMGYDAMERTEENQVEYEKERDDIIDSYLKASLAELDTTFRQTTQDEESIANYERDKQETIDYYNELKNRYPYTEPKAEAPEVKKPVDKRKTDSKSTKGLRDIKFEFDEPLLKRIMKAMPSIAEDPELYDKIAKRLIERIPFVIPRAALKRGLKESFEFYGGDPKVLGRSFGVAVEWSAERAKISTPPHEFFHAYFKVMGSTPIVKLAVKKFKDLPEVKNLFKRPDIHNDKEAVEEYLAQFIGPMYVKRTLASVPAKVKAWFKRFWLYLKKMFAPLKLTAQDLRTIIFEEFYRGATPGMTAEEASLMADRFDEAAMAQSYEYDESESHIEPVNEDGSKEGVSQEYDYRSSSLIHYNTYFSKSFGRYINRKHHAEMVELAILNKEAGFDSFLEEVKIFANDNLLDKDGVGVDLERQYSRHEINYLIQFFVKSNSRIKVYDPELDDDAVDKRIYLDLFIYDTETAEFKDLVKERGLDIGKWNFIPSQSEELGNNENNRRKRPSYRTSSFVELQDKVKTIHLPHNNIVKVVPNSKYSEQDEQEAIDRGNEYNHPREFVFPANMKINGGHIREWDEIFSDDYSYEDSRLLFIAAVKGSTDGAIFIGAVPNNMVDMDEQSFREYLDGEVEKGFMTQGESNSILEETVRYSMTNSQIFSQQASKHEWWKNVQGSGYLSMLRKGKPMSIRDHFNRLRLDFTEGTTPLGLGDTKLMLFAPDEVTLKVNGEDVSLEGYAGTYKFDGWLMSSGHFFKDLSNTIGRKAGRYENKMNESKTVIRHLSDDLVDYLGLKMMQMTPFEGMEFFRDGEKFAEVKVRRGETVFVDTVTGNEFHHLGSVEEAKMISGKFDRDKEHGGLSDDDGFYKLHNIGEQDIKVLFSTPESSKKNAAYPVAEGELTLDPSLEGNPDYEKYLNTLKDHYRQIGGQWVSDLFSMHTNPRILRNALYKPVVAGAVPTELQKYIEIFGESGEGLHLPYILQLAQPYINNVFINDGLNKLRQRNEMSTILKLKPRIGGEEGTVAASAINSVIRNRAKSLYIDSEIRGAQLPTTFGDESVDEAIDNFEAKPLSEQIVDINDFLKRNPIKVKISRQPVTGPSVTIMRDLNELKTGYGYDGETFFMNDDDIYKIQADFDGDSVSVEMFENKQIESSLAEWQETAPFKNRDKTAYTGIFLTKKKHTLIMSYSDFLKEVADITVASNSQGVVTNSKVIGNILAYKELKLKMKDDKGKLKDVTFEAVQPSDIVVLDYAPLDKDALMENDFNLFNLLKEQGDSVVTLEKGKFREVTEDELSDIKAKLYLQTTHEHEMTNILQLSVDDVSLGLLSKIGYSYNMLISRMFKRSDGGRISGKGMLHLLKAVRDVYNYSPTRRGVVSGEKASMAQNINESLRINSINESSSLRRNTSLKNHFNGMSSPTHPSYVRWYRGFEVLSVSVNDKITPIEELLSLLGKEHLSRIESVDSDSQYISEWGGSPGMYTNGAYVTAHVNAMEKLENEWSSFAAERGITDSEMSKAVKLMSKIDRDFKALFKDAKNSRPGKFIRLRAEYNDALQKVIDDHIDEWNNLSDNSQIYATLYYLSGTATRDRAGKPALRVDVRRLLPLDLMHGATIRSYGRLWWQMLQKDMDSKFKKPRDTRGKTYKEFKFGKALQLANKTSEDICG